VPTAEPSAGEPVRHQYRFGEFLLDTDGFLRRNGEEVPLRPKAFDVLRCLVLHHGKLVTKNELVAAAWPDTAVTDNSLSQCLFEIRRALDDDAQTIIRTVARRGYVFDAAVSIVFADRARGGSDLVLVDPPDEPRRDDPIHVIGRSGRIGWVSAAVGAVSVIGIAVAAAVVRMDRAVPNTPLLEPPVQLTDFADSATSPSLSHDGRLLVFIRGGAFGIAAAPRGQVYLKVLPNGTPVQLTSDASHKDHPVFSPDDARIVYTSLMPGLSWNSAQVAVGGGAPQPFLPNASGVMWLDGRRLVYSTILSGIHMAIATSTESRSEYRNLYVPSAHDGMAHRSSPSPDGKSLLVVEMSRGIWLPCRLVPSDGSSKGRVVGPASGLCTTASWSPDGRWMYFSSNAGGAFHIWRQRYPDGTPQQLTFGPTEEEGTAITPDGRYLVTSMGLQQASIWLHDGDRERQLTDEGFAMQPTLAPSRTRMFYVVRAGLSNAEANGELWSVDIATGTRQRVVQDLTVSNYSLSRDGTRVLFTHSAGDEDDGIWIADFDRRVAPRQLVRGRQLRAFFGAQGEIVYSGDGGRLFRIREDQPEPHAISPDPIAYLSTVSPDGRWAVVIRPQSANGIGTTSLAFMSLGGERSFDVCNEKCSVGPRSFTVVAPFVWSADGTRLFVNLVHFGAGTAKTVALPYRFDAAPEALWPKGLRQEADVLAAPGARVIDAASTFPAAEGDAYLVWRASMHSNVYRLRLGQ